MSTAPCAVRTRRLARHAAASAGRRTERTGGGGAALLSFVLVGLSSLLLLRLLRTWNIQTRGAALSAISGGANSGEARQLHRAGGRADIMPALLGLLVAVCSDARQNNRSVAPPPHRTIAQHRSPPPPHRLFIAPPPMPVHPQRLAHGAHAFYSPPPPPPSAATVNASRAAAAPKSSATRDALLLQAHPPPPPSPEVEAMSIHPASKLTIVHAQALRRCTGASAKSTGPLVTVSIKDWREGGSILVTPPVDAANHPSHDGGGGSSASGASASTLTVPASQRSLLRSVFALPDGSLLFTLGSKPAIAAAYAPRAPSRVSPKTFQDTANAAPGAVRCRCAGDTQR